jgi:hypothetical protein
LLGRITDAEIRANGKNVEIPVGVHQFLAVMVVSIGSPLLRRFAIGLLALCGVILLAGTLIHCYH